MVVVDPRREMNAVREARKLGLVVIGILDTDCDPEGVDIVIPGNDDALRSVRLLVNSLVGSVEEGASAHRERMASTGVAERSEDMPEGEPRPTRAQNLPKPRTEEGDRSAEIKPVASEGGAGSTVPAAESSPS
jgi:small subunit ribosomal protein S2